eukprot:TRINITY_DN7218_c0_g1_i1.p1 TRINITY_DN7218_c0_g1~~TRINITY_DN7218_c0_g1_i1.p1  ORF type:complete len:559 (-),score=84.26 TRINITY_DN7218_c0_g1_i1:54-1730(-)
MAPAGDKMEETKAEARTEPQKTTSIPMLKATDGRKYCFEHDAIIILISKGWFSQPAKDRMLWTSIQKCDLVWGCCSGMLTLKRENGQVITFRGGPGKVKRAATVVQQRLNIDKKDDCLDKYEDVLEQIKGRSSVKGAGVNIEYATWFGCRGESHFVPWDSVVSARSAIGCFGGSIIMKTAIEDKKAQQAKIQVSPKAAKDPKDAKKEKEDSKEQALVDQNACSYVEVSLKCKTGSTSDIFRIITGLMAKGRTAEPVKDVPAIKRTEVTEAGVFSGYAKNQLFLPWTSMTSVDYSAQLVGRAAVVVTDRCGDQCVLRGVTHDGFMKFREIYLQSGNLEGSESVKPIVRKNVTIMPDGVIVSHRNWCSTDTRSYPWSVVDGADMETTCCGGSVILCTEGGERIPVYSSGCFATGRLHEIWNRIREMKYQINDENPGHPIWFAGPPHHPRTCMITDKAIRLTSQEGFCKRRVHLVDLDSVREVKAQKDKGCCKPHYLRVTFSSNMKVHRAESVKEKALLVGKPNQAPAENVILVKLSKRDNGPSLARQIMQRSKVRQGEEP